MLTYPPSPGKRLTPHSDTDEWDSPTGDRVLSDCDLDRGSERTKQIQVLPSQPHRTENHGKVVRPAPTDKYKLKEDRKKILVQR